MQKIEDILQKIRTWSSAQEHYMGFIVACSAVVGCLAGFGAFILKRVIYYVALWLHKGLSHVSLERFHADWWLLVLPLIGILIAVAWQKWVARANMVHCTKHIVEYLNSKNYAIPARMTYDPIAACGITLGFGGSAGAEGPIAYAGAAVGSKLGRLLGLDSDMLRVLIGIGAGAGIAGIFKSPIAGVLFALEVLRMDMAAGPVVGLVMACICASVTCYAFTGTHLYLPFYTDPGRGVPIHWVMALGVFCGIYAVAYNHITIVMRRFFESRKKQWVTWLTGGLIAGASLLAFPCIYGEGYPVMTRLINGDSDILQSGLLAVSSGDTSHFLWVLGLLLIVKALATVCSNSAGGVAGDFAPTLFAGAVAGTLFSLLANHLLGIDIPVSLCALFAMAGTFAGTIHAPVMAIFLITEMTGMTKYMLPVTVCALFAYITVKIVTPASRYVETRYDDLASLFMKPKNKS